MSERKIYIARDGKEGTGNGEEIWLYREKPEYEDDCFSESDGVPSSTWQSFPLSSLSFPGILNGECYEFELKEGKKL